VAVVVGAAACIPALAAAQVPMRADAEMIAIGKKIYREGVLPSGHPLQGLAPAGVVLSGQDAACATCHRRSGYGSSEGRIEVRAITGPALFGTRVAPPAPVATTAPEPAGVSVATSATPAQVARDTAIALRAARAAAFAGTRPRPAYDDDSLARAIREGIDVGGHEMNPSMPRYALEPAAQAALGAYLKTLSAEISPGVTEDAVHLATVIQPDSDPTSRRALLDVLQTFVRDRNLSKRTEVRREQAGMVRLRRTYREWVLHVWELSGDSDTWGAQLETLYRARPVFALVSGLGARSWRPIHEFSEQFEVPCIFPQTALPALGEPDFYTLYLSRGMALEAQALAKFLHDEGARGAVVQVSRPDPASAAAADAFRKAWVAGDHAAPLERLVEHAPDAAFWQQLAAQVPGATWVLWLPPQDVVQALAAPRAGLGPVYLSSGLGAADTAHAAAAGTSDRIRLVHPLDLPELRAARLETARAWLRKSGIDLTDEALQMNAYLAATVTGMALSHSADTWSRELLLERLEHGLGSSGELSIYPRLSLGPGQRYASKGSYIVQVDGGRLKPLSEWIVP
jgi:hypothetical protein